MATLNDLDSLSEMVFMLWPEGYTILSLQQEIFQSLYQWFGICVAALMCFFK